MRLRFVTARDLRETFLFPISSVLTSLSVGFEKSNKVGPASGFKTNFFILYPMEAANKGFTTNCSLVKWFAQSLELFDGTKSFLFTLIVHNLRRLSSLGNSNIPIPWPDLVLQLYATQYTILNIEEMLRSDKFVRCSGSSHINWLGTCDVYLKGRYLC